MDDVFTGDFAVKNKQQVARFAAHLQKWFAESIKTAWDRASLKPDRWKLALGCIVYGERYTDRFLKYCVPSLLAEGNLPAIKDSPVWIIIQTDDASISKLKADSGLQALGKMGICIEIQTIPQEIIDGVAEEEMNKYWLLGAAHNLQMQHAKYLGYGFHMLMPDHVYSRNYFVNLRRVSEGKDAIVQAALSARIEEADELNNDGILSIDSKELNAIALDHLHRQFQPYIMNGRDYKTDCPVHSFMFFIGRDTVHIMCPHMSPVYFSHAALMKCPLRLFNTIDSQLPFFLPESANVYAPKPQDDMSYIEISDDNKPFGVTPPTDILNFCIAFWMLTYSEKGFLRYLNLDNILGLPDGYAHPIDPMNDDEIYTTLTEVRKQVADSFDKIFPVLEKRYQKDPLPHRAA